MAEWENKLELLESESLAFENLLNELKKETLSENVRRQKEKEAKDKAEKLKWQIDGLRWNKWIDEKLEAAIDRAQGLLDTYAELSKLQDSIWDKKESTKQPASTGEEVKQSEKKEEKEEKSFLWKWRERTKDKWSKIPKGGKWALWAIWAALAGTWIYKKFFWKKEDKKEWWKWDEQKESNKEKWEKKGSSRWKKWLAIATAWVVWFIWYKNWDKIKWLFEKEKPLTIQEAVVNVSAEVSSWLIDESPFKYQFEGITFDENKETVKSYWWETKIDVNKRKLEWLDDVVFPDYKELIHAANIVNCLKRSFHHCCYDNSPFSKTTGWWWDLQVHLANNKTPECLSASDTNAWAWIWWVGWWILGGILWAYCWWTIWAVWWAAVWGAWWALGWDYLDKNSSMWKTVSTIASWNNFGKFIAYLNMQTTQDGKSLRAHENEQIRTETPIQKQWQKVLEEIMWTYSDNWSNYDRNIDIRQDPQNPSCFYIESYNEKVPLTIEWCTVTWNWKLDYSKIKSIKIGKYYETDWWKWLELEFPHNENWVREAIKTANLTNFIRKNFHDKWWEKYPFWMKMYGFHRHLQINDKWFRGRDVLNRDVLEQRFPTLWSDLKNQIDQRDQSKLHSQAYNNKDEKWCKSKYLRYLHQMREQRGIQSFWKKDK